MSSTKERRPTPHLSITPGSYLQPNNCLLSLSHTLLRKTMCGVGSDSKVQLSLGSVRGWSRRCINFNPSQFKSPNWPQMAWAGQTIGGQLKLDSFPLGSLGQKVILANPYHQATKCFCNSGNVQMFGSFTVQQPGCKVESSFSAVSNLHSSLWSTQLHFTAVLQFQPNFSSAN